MNQAALEELKNNWTETEQVILKRRSVRMYKKEQVPEFMIRRLLEAGRFAPSAGNCQPWKFVVLRDQEIIDGITATTVKWSERLSALLNYKRATNFWRKPLAKLITLLQPADLHPTPFGAVSLIADGKLGLYHDAPTVILIFQDVRGIANPSLDCGIAGQNMVLAAHSMGLGTCWVGFSKLAFQYSKVWKKRLGIGYPYKFITSLAVGFPVAEPDGMVERPTHAVDWYEAGSKQIIY